MIRTQLFGSGWVVIQRLNFKRGYLFAHRHHAELCTSLAKAWPSRIRLGRQAIAPNSNGAVASHLVESVADPKSFAWVLFGEIRAAQYDPTPAVAYIRQVRTSIGKHVPHLIQATTARKEFMVANDHTHIHQHHHRHNQHCPHHHRHQTR